MTVTFNESQVHATISSVERPYANVPASELADTLESTWGVEPFNEEIVSELLTRALEAEGQIEHR
jgi:hypothetical protein